MHEVSWGSWISLLPFLCVTPLNCYLISAARICEGAYFCQKGTHEVPHLHIHRLLQKVQAVQHSCNSESLAYAVMCISYLSGAVMTYKSNTVTLRDLVTGAASQ